MKSLNTKVLTTYALFLAIMLIMAFVPGLGFIPTSVAAIVIIQVPVIIASYFLGFKGGMFFGLVFGLTSVIKCFTEPDAFAMIIMNAGGLKTVGLMIICLIVPRIMIGVTSRAVYTLFNKFDKTRISSMAVAAFVGTITNTILFLGAFYLFAKDACMAQFGAATADAFWPGPLTMVYLKSDIVPPQVTAGLSTVAVRMPEHKTALALIRAAGVPIAAPSANLSGKPSPTCAQHVLDDLDGCIDAIIDGGDCRVGVESTVLSLVGTPTVLRPGGVTREMLESVIGHVDIAHAVLNPLKNGETAASPGMKYKHYAPECDVVIADGGNDCKKTASIACREYTRAELSGKKCIILATEQTKSRYSGKRHVVIGDRTQPQTLCAALFRELRNESRGMDLIIAESVPAEAQGLAYMNRLLRAAGFTVISE